MIAGRASESRGIPTIIVSRPIARITTCDRTKGRPPGPHAPLTEAPIGTAATVAARNHSRTGRALPDTAFADHVNWVHVSQISENSSNVRPASAHVGWWARKKTSWANAKTYDRSKNSSTGSAVKSSPGSGTVTPRMPDLLPSVEAVLVDDWTARGPDQPCCPALRWSATSLTSSPTKSVSGTSLRCLPSYGRTATVRADCSSPPTISV